MLALTIWLTVSLLVVFSPIIFDDVIKWRWRRRANLRRIGTLGWELPRVAGWLDGSRGN